MRQPVIEVIYGDLTVWQPIAVAAPAVTLVSYVTCGIQVLDSNQSGVTNPPVPLLDGQDSWMYHRGLTLINNPGSCQSSAVHRFVIATKTKRKLDVFNDQLALVITNSANSTFAASFAVQLRILVSDK